MLDNYIEKLRPIIKGLFSDDYSGLMKDFTKEFLKEWNVDLD